MSGNSDFSLPNGLPARIGDTDAGYVRLCKFLGLSTRRDRQEVLGITAFKAAVKQYAPTGCEKLKTAGRIQCHLTTVYSLSDMRRDVWALSISKRGVKRPRRVPCPSIEYLALEKYDINCFDAVIDESRISNCQGFFDLDSPVEKTSIPALVALPLIQADFMKWGTLTERRKNDVLLAAFSVATILDDVRLLQWAVSEIDEAAEAYGFISTPWQPAVPGSKRPNPEADADKSLEAVCDSLILTIQELKKGPRAPDLFDKVVRFAEQVNSWREQALSEADSDEAGRLIASFDDYVQFHVKDSNATWLDLNGNIRECWEQATSVQVRDKAIWLKDELRRRRKELAQGFKDWAKVAGSKSEAERVWQECREHREAASGDFQALLEISRKEPDLLEQVIQSREREEQAKLVILGAMYPSGERFDDYRTRNPESSKGPSGQQGSELVSPNLGEHSVSDHDPEGPISADPSDGGRTVSIDRQTRVDPASEDIKERSEVSGESENKPKLRIETEKKNEAPSKKRKSLKPEDAAIWKAVGHGRLGLAHYIAGLRLKNQPRSRVHPSPELLAAVAIGERLDSPGGAMAQAFGRYAESILSNLDFRKLDPSTRNALNLLLFCASVRPAIFAPQTGAISLLLGVELSVELAPVYRLAEKIAACAQRLQGVYFDISRLSSILDGTSWEIRMDAHVAEVEKWTETAKFKNFSYSPAAKVWKAWIAQNGPLTKLAEMISSPDKSHEPEVRDIVNRLADKKGIASLIGATRDNIPAIKSSESILGAGLKQLENHAMALGDLAQEWFRITESRSGTEGFVEETVSEVRRHIDNLAPEILTVLVKEQDAGPDPVFSAALVRTHSVVESLVEMFSNERKSGGEGTDVHEMADPDRILLRDLLCVTNFDISNPGTASAASQLKMLIDTGAHATSLAAAFKTRLEREDLSGAHAVCEELKRQCDPAENECRNALSSAISERRREIEPRLDDLNVKLEQAYTVGEADENELSSLNGEILDLKTMINQDRADSEMTVATWGARFTTLEADITKRFKKATKRVLNQFKPRLPLSDPIEQQFVEDALKNNDLILLYEILDCIKAGQPVLPKEKVGCTRLKEFLSFEKGLETEMESDDPPTPNLIVKSALNGIDILGLRFASLNSLQRASSGKLLESWFTMARKCEYSNEEVKAFLAGLGFTVKKCVSAAENNFSIQVEPLRSRDLCPVHTFGSDTNGRYDVILIPRMPAAESLIQSVRRNPNKCTILLYFGRLGETRNWLRYWSIRNSRLFLVIDESLMLYLSASFSNKLRALFDCTVPFTAVEPFFTAAGLVPPESFYGREKERGYIMDRRGSCFVYGGRQLGKTALLRSAEDTFNHPESGKIAKCIDLKVHDIGIAQGPERIWDVLWQELESLGVIKSDRRPRGRESLVKELARNVREWIDQDESDDKRILLLLDEADDFLKSDMKSEFRESTRLKGLMDETDRKFKVVFSGLHNVLRTTERANHPLAHFGEPICVGPLLSNGELEQARALLMEPLSAVGCEFKSYDLVTYILVWTNYYPSLIQSCGAELVKYFHYATERDFPNVIKRDDVKAVLERYGLRENIRQRFSLTLQLDPRYEVIAYAIALQLQGKGEELFRGLNTTEILEQVKDWWPDGFNLSEKEFETLLQEMCGLGVLRCIRSTGKRRRYTFRNPNVLLLLGDSDEISRVLEKEREKPDGTFEVSEFHAPHTDGYDSMNRGPLTYEQETQLRRRGGVTIISGTDAADIETLGNFLKQRMEDSFRELEFCTDDVALGRQLSALRPENDRGVHIYMVPKQVPWTSKWVETAVQTLKRLKRGVQIRIVFPAGPNQLWRIVEDIDIEYLDDGVELFDWFGLHPWSQAFLRRWCSDLDMHLTASQVKQLGEITGGWPRMVNYYFSTDCEKNHDKEMDFLRFVATSHEEMRGLLGIDTDAAQREISLLRDYGALTPHDARDVIKLDSSEHAGTDDENMLVRRLWWARQLGLVQDINGKPCINPLLDTVLQTDVP